VFVTQAGLALENASFRRKHRPELREEATPALSLKARPSRRRGARRSGEED
jgi:hypothetical protein